MAGRWPFTAEKIASRLALIQPFVHRRAMELPHFRLLPLNEPQIDAPICADPTHWEEIASESYWGSADLNFVLKSHFKVPVDWAHSHLALHLPLGVIGDIFNHPEALVHIDTVPIGSADRYHHTIPLSPDVADRRRHTLSLHGWTGLAGWPPDPNSKAKLFMGRPSLVERSPELIEFVSLAESALETARHPDVSEEIRERLLAALDASFKILDTRAPIGAALYESVPEATSALREGIAKAGEPLDRKLHAIGHAHMDIAYLWPVSQIRLKNARTYSNVLRMMDEDPSFQFSHSQPQLYALVEQDYPAIFEKIKDRVAAGQWEIMGGTWVEPDLNIPGPEALVRQLTLGQGYFQDRFGSKGTPVLWLPDTFGFPAQIPQLMRHAGLTCFVTNKLNWNQKNRVPWSTHNWEGLDGSRVLAHVLTTPRDVQYLPFPTNYKSDLTAAEVLGTVINPTIPEAVTALPICFGYGDGGGGPTDDLRARARNFAKMPGMPQLVMSSVQDAMRDLEAVADDLPVWRGEHYMEGHRGVLTSQGWIKRANRKAERALHEAEALSAMAGIPCDLTEAWQLLCLNQFHDIVTGTSISEVFEDARRDFGRIAKLTEAAAQKAEAALASNTAMVANVSPISGPRVVECPDFAAGSGQSVDGGKLLYFKDLPGYASTPLDEATDPTHPVQTRLDRDGFVLENDRVLAVFDASARLVQLTDKSTERDVISAKRPANQLQAFEDRPLCWDAWDIDPFFEDRTENIAADAAFEIIETGPIRASVRVTWPWKSSTVSQIIRLSAHSARIDFETEVDWHETHTLLKVAFPTNIKAPTAEFDVQWGFVERSTARETSFDQARFEVCAHKWARLSDGTYSVSVLNDCKYGHDVRDDTIRLTLIKSSTAPDPTADQGMHVFTYSLLPLLADDRATLDHEAYALNSPLRIVPAAGQGSQSPKPFVVSDKNNVIVETLKPADRSNATVLRVFEAHGIQTSVRFEFRDDVQAASRVAFDETVIERLTVDGQTVHLDLKPFEIYSLLIEQ